jgi:hypothetical protein
VQLWHFDSEQLRCRLPEPPGHGAHKYHMKERFTTEGFTFNMSALQL